MSLTTCALAPTRICQPLNSRGLASVSELPAFQAAPPLNLANLPPIDTSSARIVPASSSYFTSRPNSTDKLLELQTLALRYQTLPTVDPAQAPRKSWRSLTEYRLLIGETVQASKHGKAVDILKRLNRIHPSVMPQEVRETLDFYKRNMDKALINRRPAVIDEDGKTFQVGKRKSSTAKVFVVQGEGKVLINEKALNTAFARPHDRDSALWALRATDRLDKYNIWALVSGGGTTGQAEAITLGVAKALLVFEPNLKPALRRGQSDHATLMGFSY